jgi:DNA gyrase subunit A
VKGTVGNISDEDFVADTETALVYTAGGYIKRTDPSEYRSQKRGGVGVIDMDTKEEDVVTHLLLHQHMQTCCSSQTLEKYIN